MGRVYDFYLRSCGASVSQWFPEDKTKRSPTDVNVEVAYYAGLVSFKFEVSQQGRQCRGLLQSYSPVVEARAGDDGILDGGIFSCVVWQARAALGVQKLALELLHVVSVAARGNGELGGRQTRASSDYHVWTGHAAQVHMVWVGTVDWTVDWTVDCRKARPHGPAGLQPMRGRTGRVGAGWLRCVLGRQRACRVRGTRLSIDNPWTWTGGLVDGTRARAKQLALICIVGSGLVPVQ